MDIQFLTIELIELVDSLHVWWRDKIKEKNQGWLFKVVGKKKQKSVGSWKLNIDEHLLDLATWCPLMIIAEQFGWVVGTESTFPCVKSVMDSNFSTYAWGVGGDMPFPLFLGTLTSIRIPHSIDISNNLLHFRGWVHLCLRTMASARGFCGASVKWGYLKYLSHDTVVRIKWNNAYKAVMVLGR